MSLQRYVLSLHHKPINYHSCTCTYTLLWVIIIFHYQYSQYMYSPLLTHSCHWYVGVCVCLFPCSFVHLFTHVFILHSLSLYTCTCTCTLCNLCIIFCWSLVGCVYSVSNLCVISLMTSLPRPSLTDIYSTIQHNNWIRYNVHVHVCIMLSLTPSLTTPCTTHHCIVVVHIDSTCTCSVNVHVHVHCQWFICVLMVF